MPQIKKLRLNNPNWGKEVVVHNDDILRFYNQSNIKSDFRRKSNITQWAKRRLFFRKQLKNGTSNYCLLNTGCRYH